MDSHLICAVIVTFNPDLDLFLRQLMSLVKQVDLIIVVDNDSKNIDQIELLLNSDNLKDILKSCLLKNASNVGLGKAQNDGIKLAISKSATHVLLFDQDSVLNEGFVEGLIASEIGLKKGGFKVAAVGPTYYNELTGEIYPITKYIGPFIERIQPEDDPVQATFLIASGCLISVDIFDKIGYMNEDLFIDYIDVEWSFRAKSLGYGVYATPLAKMSHTIGDNRISIFGRTISVHSPLRRYYLFRNSIYMVKNPSISIGYKIREVVFNTFRFIVFLVLSNDRGMYFKYSFSGFKDGFKGVIGKCPHNFNNNIIGANKG
ncbi:glycosyltransferase family 2 protein [Pedobacter nutrimenti]|uniref:glycosyltransferase family 2 protein n=1 Tax=Pedobacter nutrimenti TaxID=1241337 RepID=UPI00292FC896|nr:glycosyltransferase family 2 protein [Pedobacter nutrimenti]